MTATFWWLRVTEKRNEHVFLLHHHISIECSSFLRVVAVHYICQLCSLQQVAVQFIYSVADLLRQNQLVMDIRCLCCSITTIERKQSHKSYAIELTLPKRQKLCYDEYMCCSVCSSKVCFSCCEKLHLVIEKKRNLLSQRSLSFLNELKSFVLNRTYDTESFIAS